MLKETSVIGIAEKAAPVYYLWFALNQTSL